MSFRKRSIRPNLNISKRQTPSVNEQKNEAPANIPNEEKPVQEKEMLTDQTVAPIDSKLQVKEGIPEKEESSSPSIGKRLSKRTKVAPKLTQKKTSTINNVEVGSSPSSCIQSIPNSSMVVPIKDNEKNGGNLLESTPEKSTHVMSHIPEATPGNHQEVLQDIIMDKSGEVDKAMDVLSVYKILTSKNKDENKSSIKDIEETQEQNSPDIPVENSQTNVNKEKRIPKRKRVMPKLTSSRSVNKESNDNDTDNVHVGKEVSENLTVDNTQSSLNKDEYTSIIAVNNDNNECIRTDSNLTSKFPQKEASDVIYNNDEKEVSTSSKTSRLQKRVKVRPKLTLRTSACSTTTHVKDTLDRNDISKNESSNIDESRTMNVNMDDDNVDRTNSENICTSSKLLERVENISNIQNECDRTKKAQCIGSDNEHDNLTNFAKFVCDENETLNSSNCFISNNDSSVNLTSEKKELKHVRFTYNEDYVDNSEDSQHLTEITSKHISPDNVDMEDDSSLKSPIPTENRNVRYDSNDEYDSLSEGDILGKQLISKNKVFKPNLVAKRRERLSSFTAYSSCDEEDWKNQKRRKKKKAKKTPDESTEEESKVEDEKKKKPKNPTKQKKDRENLEPNVEKVPKKRKKKAKSDSVKPVKHQEERDLSSLTMQELIHYNHPSFKTVELRSKRDEDENERVIEIGNVASTVPSDEKPEVDQKLDGGEVMAPQLMINEDGEIVINQESLTISQKVDDSSLKNSAVVYEDSLSYGTHLKRKHVVTKRWKIEETLRFYKALSEIGTDFTLMSQAFGRFSRNELKKKFKKEEKVNCDLVDRALSNRLPLNMEMFLRGKEELKDNADVNANDVTKTPKALPNADVIASDGDICLVENGKVWDV